MLGFSLVAWAGDKKNKPPSNPVVDSGSFGVYVKGQRVITESFHVEQQNGISTVKAQLKEAASSSTVQKCELEMTSAGELIHYDWSQEGGGSVTVLPSNDFLIEKITASATGKPSEQPFLMPVTTMILDNNFFVLREVMVWRYLAADCKPEGCQQSPLEFGVLVPQDHTSTRVRVELVGKEKVSIHGAERELLRVNLTGESFAWALWVDAQDQFKLIKVSISADNTEVVRD
jgi:hypothetical protein